MKHVTVCLGVILLAVLPAVDAPRAEGDPATAAPAQGQSMVQASHEVHLYRVESGKQAAFLTWLGLHETAATWCAMNPAWWFARQDPGGWDFVLIREFGDGELHSRQTEHLRQLIADMGIAEHPPYEYQRTHIVSSNVEWGRIQNSPVNFLIAMVDPGRNEGDAGDDSGGAASAGGTCTVPAGCQQCRDCPEEKYCKYERKPCSEVTPSDLKKCDNCKGASESGCCHGSPTVLDPGIILGGF